MKTIKKIIMTLSAILLTINAIAQMPITSEELGRRDEIDTTTSVRDSLLRLLKLDRREKATVALNIVSGNADDYRAKAEQGDAEAQFNLGLCYYNGKGVEKSASETLKWLQKSARQDYKSSDYDYVPAQFLLGFMYEEGIGVEINIDQAVNWYALAAANPAISNFEFYQAEVNKVLISLNIDIFKFSMRYNTDQIFYDTRNNSSNSSTYLLDSKASFIPRWNYSGKGNPKFQWTQKIKEQKGEVQPLQRLKIIESDNPYWIQYFPRTRAYDNLIIRYDIIYSNDKEGKMRWVKHDLVFYEITWCGDGRIDTDYGEECDDGNNNDGDGCSCDCKKENLK